MARRLRGARRGVLLLIVLALLAIFGMMAVSFVLLASQARRAAELSEMAAQTSSTWQTDMDQAMHIVLRGDTNPMEPLWPHSLLENLYGNNTTNPTAVTGVTTIGTQITGVAASGITEPERRVGTVLTMLTGQAVTAANGIPQSFRIVAYDTNSGLMHVLSNGAPVNVGEYFFINGVPFSGMGTGFDRTLANMNPTATNFGLLLSLTDTDSIRTPCGRMPPRPAGRARPWTS